MDLDTRVRTAAEAALADHQYVSFIDVLTGMSLLHNVHAWHNGRVEDLDEMVQGGPEKLRQVIDILQRWAAQRGLRAEDLPPHSSYIRTPPKHPAASRIQAREQAFRLHFVSPQLTDKKLEKLREKLNSAAPPTVFSIVDDSKCAQCQEELWKGDLLTMQGNQPLCMECAGLDHLVYLASGDAALTRRATKHSSLWAKVLRFSRTRGRYERQGILVQPEALEKAEEECLSARMAAKTRMLFPGCPPAEARAIAAHTARRGSGRVGRSAAGRALSGDALQLAVGTWVRHRHTRYDDLLMKGREG